VASTFRWKANVRRDLPPEGGSHKFVHRTSLATGQVWPQDKFVRGVQSARREHVVPLLLNETAVRAVLTMPDLIAAMRTALAQYSAGEAQQPLRTVLEIGDEKSYFGVMPATTSDPRAVGTKLVTVFASNRDIGLPTHLATIVLLDPDTGALVALVDGRFITEARTAAVSAVSVDLLANKNAARLAVIGSGVQARSHVEALGWVRRLTEIRVWSPNEARRHAFVEDVKRRVDAEVTAFPSAREAVDGANLIVLATSSQIPVVYSQWVDDGAHICAVGACRPTHREMDSALVARARTFVDSRSGALTEAGDIVLAIAEGVIERDHLAGEIGELVAGKVAGRTAAREVTLFKSLGMAVEDVAAAHLAWTRAKQRGLGQEALST
jgi:ornithine cyclodeaminase/alanine dehydrogenase-like protein (mu-crystallin family)